MGNGEVKSAVQVPTTEQRKPNKATTTNSTTFKLQPPSPIVQFKGGHLFAEMKIGYQVIVRKGAVVLNEKNEPRTLKHDEVFCVKDFVKEAQLGIRDISLVDANAVTYHMIKDDEKMLDEGVKTGAIKEVTEEKETLAACEKLFDIEYEEYVKEQAKRSEGIKEIEKSQHLSNSANSTNSKTHR